MKFETLRKKYPKFIYRSFSYKISKNNLEIFFDFELCPGIFFKPKIKIKNADVKKIKRAGESALNNFAFSLGLIEMISYWKAACPPEIEIKAGSLNTGQIKWWKGLIREGMGQFFYENKINFKKPGFLKIKSTGPKWQGAGNLKLKNEYLVPIGGGKDSAVTLERLKKKGKKVHCFSLNPTIAAQNIIKIGKCKKPIIAERKMDKKLLELNRKGFLNGHTPFSALLAFLCSLTAAVSGIKYIALSNERSSNEGNVRYLGKIINHQYSKSSDFEKKFRRYSKKYLAKDIEYFSYLRPFWEIQIARLFSNIPKYFPVFLSCNEAYKTDSGRKKPTKKWCGKCPKCLFVFLCLYPFVCEKELIKIFGKNLFKDRRLLPIMQELAGERKFKPFECVGTKKESLIGLYLSWKKEKDKKKPPFLLNYFEKKILPKYKNLERESKKIFN